MNEREFFIGGIRSGGGRVRRSGRKSSSEMPANRWRKEVKSRKKNGRMKEREMETGAHWHTLFNDWGWLLGRKFPLHLAILHRRSLFSLFAGCLLSSQSAKGRYRTVQPPARASRNLRRPADTWSLRQPLRLSTFLMIRRSVSAFHAVRDRGQYGRHLTVKNVSTLLCLRAS